MIGAVRRLAAVACVVLVCSATQPAVADDQADAREEFKKAETAYAVREFGRAVGHYKKAYELSKKPALLFNTAQALKLNGDFKEAVHFYESYLRLSPDPPNRLDVERYIDESKRRAIERDRREADLRKLEAQRKNIEGQRETVEAERKRLEAEAAARKAEAELARAKKEGTREPNEGLKLTGLITAGVSLAVVGGGVFFALKASSDFDVVNSATEWSTELDETRESAESARTLSIVLTSVGAAGVVTGTVLYFIGRRGKLVEPSTVTIVPTRGGAHVGFSGRF